MEISVVMPVYNGEKYIAESIASVLNQTFRDFEFIIIDDGSTDRTIDEIKKFEDPRIRLVYHEHDFIGTLNQGIALAQGKYIARMDVDDVMMSQRLEIQYNLMEQLPEIVVCASNMEAFGQLSGLYGSYKGKIVNPLLRMLCGNIIVHPTVMIRKAFLQEHHLQYEYYDYAEDYRLWSEIAKRGGVFYVIPISLLKYRTSPDQVTQRKVEEQRETVLRIQSEILDYLVERCPFKKVKELYKNIDDLNERDLVSEDTAFRLFAEIFNSIECQAEKMAPVTTPSPSGSSPR